MRAILKRYLARSVGEIVDQPFSKAFRAALTATSISSGVSLPDLGERLLGRRVDRLVGLLRLDPVASDEEAVAVSELNEVARLRSRRVLPGGRNRRAILFAL